MTVLVIVFSYCDLFLFFFVLNYFVTYLMSFFRKLEVRVRL